MKTTHQTIELEPGDTLKVIKPDGSIVIFEDTPQPIRPPVPMPTHPGANDVLVSEMLKNKKP